MNTFENFKEIAQFFHNKDYYDQNTS